MRHVNARHHVVRQDLRQRFILARHVRFNPQGIAELPLMALKANDEDARFRFRGDGAGKRAASGGDENAVSGGETSSLLRSIRDLPTSLMPEKLLDALNPQERRDLFRYL